MSRQQVRNATAEWLLTAEIPNLNQIFSTFKKLLDFEDNAQVGESSRAAATVFIAGETEERLSVGGAYDGWKRVDYGVQLIIKFYSSGEDEDEIMLDFDTVIDGVKNQLRNGGHRLGLANGEVIWQAAEGVMSSTYGLPDTNDDGITTIDAAIEFTVTQMIQA